MSIDVKVSEVLEELNRCGVDVSGCTGTHKARLKRELKTSIEMEVSMADMLVLVDGLDDVVGWEYYGLRLR